ncbi:hypothetical protein [Aquimarina algiphila]|uniref:hypothetical protein n=1 Tax=Aquimarina algiphila TaxID=2047982 RepID=UPI002492F1A1|nr:hypothetical protein [Aquimarina algiphila]
MKRIYKGQPPTSFIEYKREEGASFEEMDGNVKIELQKSLLNEQNGVCAYCQQIINSPDKNYMKIEHHCEQSICNGENGTVDRRLDYQNLFAVCLGSISYLNVRHCDTKKGDEKVRNMLPISMNPLEFNHIKTLRYTNAGTVKSSKTIFQDEIDIVLNLNNDLLKGLRKKEWFEIISASRQKTGGFNKTKMKKLIDSRLALLEGKYRYAFPAMYEFMIEKFKL